VKEESRGSRRRRCAVRRLLTIPRLLDDGLYEGVEDAAPLRVFTQLDIRLLLEDLYAKLAVHAAGEEMPTGMVGGAELRSVPAKVVRDARDRSQVELPLRPRVQHGDVVGPHALREAREEIGLAERFVSVIGYLPDHLVNTGFRVTPVVAFVQPDFELLLDAQEVQDTFEVPLEHLFDPANHHRHRRRATGSDEEVEFFDIPFGDRNIWGATAGMLLTLYRLCVGPSADE